MAYRWNEVECDTFEELQQLLNQNSKAKNKKKDTFGGNGADDKHGSDYPAGSFLENWIP